MKNGVRKKLAVIGATGYTGQELLGILAQHPLADATVVMTARADTTPELPALPVDTAVDRLDLGRLDNVDGVFLCTPHGAAAPLRAKGEILGAGLAALADQFDIVLEHRGRGLIQGLRLSTDPTPLCQWLYREGLIANVAGNNVLRLLPPYVVTEDQIGRAVALIRKGLEHVATIPTAPNGVEV